MKILAIDDDRAIVEIIGMVLEEEGFEVATLTDGAKVFETLGDFRPDLVLLDVMLGGLDGREICGRIKMDERYSGIPVIMISASHDLQHTLKLPNAPQAFIAKPFDINNLVNVVKAQLAA
ncbi:response regulator [Pedobacter sp. JY14-1]|uniref:response regulator transcription factor n=1 Tax=Pedobacter sp. JY14-1 TaxID=3034151 RepID=UPI0023E14AE3|nr:response regulator [Pedobacter sp. JY14-1]